MPDENNSLEFFQKPIVPIILAILASLGVGGHVPSLFEDKVEPEVIHLIDIDYENCIRSYLTMNVELISAEQVCLLRSLREIMVYKLTLESN